MSKSDVKKSYSWVIAFVIVVVICAVGSFLKKDYNQTTIISEHKSNNADDANVEVTDDEVRLVNVNTATLDELCSLPGITPRIARNIIAFREALGGIKNPSDLLFVPEIGDAIYEKICIYVTVE